MASVMDEIGWMASGPVNVTAFSIIHHFDAREFYPMRDNWREMKRTLEGFNIMRKVSIGS